MLISVGFGTNLTFLLIYFVGNH